MKQQQKKTLSLTFSSSYWEKQKYSYLIKILHNVTAIIEVCPKFYRNTEKEKNCYL